MLKGIEPTVVAGAFYAKLFADNPALKRLFPKDMEPQYTKLMDMLSAIVMHLDRLEEYSHEITAMAQRHLAYGAKTKHYKMAGQALLWTLERGLGADWTPETAEAWKEAYHKLADSMTTPKSKVIQ